MARPGTSGAALAALAVSLGCGDAPAGLDYSSEGYVGLEDTLLALGPSENPRNTPIWLDISAEQWDLLEGDALDSAEHVTSWPVDLSDGLWVDGVQLLPARVQLGEASEGVEVTARGEHEVYYGIFGASGVVGFIAAYRLSALARLSRADA